jgi:hypothetical protein
LACATCHVIMEKKLMEKIPAARWGKMNYTRNEWRRWSQLHSKRVEKIELHSKRVEKMKLHSERVKNRTF